MSSRFSSVRDLAREANVDVDEALVRLWDAGFDRLEDGGSRVGKGESTRARRALGIPTRRDFSSPTYWMKALGVEQAEFHSILTQLSIPIRVGTTRLPKGAIGKLRAEAGRRGMPLAAMRDSEPPISLTRVKALEWREIGHAGALRHLTSLEVEKIHEALAADFKGADDPMEPHGVRNRALLESAVFRQHTALGDTAKYPTAEMVAAAILHALVQDHPFHNGNKRTALVSMLVCLDENNLMLTCDEDGLFRLVLQVAQHRLVDRHLPELADREVMEIARWLCENTRLVDRRDRPLPWWRLKRILARHGCTTEFTRGVGNRINVLRVTERKLLRIFKRRVVLKTQVHYGGEGREATRSTIAQLRSSLELDEEHGVDSRAFYDNEPWSPSDFIIRYRKTLQRLARL